MSERARSTRSSLSLAASASRKVVRTAVIPPRAIPPHHRANRAMVPLLAGARRGARPCDGDDGRIVGWRRRRNSILHYAPNHLAFSPQRFLTATTLPQQSTQVRSIYLHSSLTHHIGQEATAALHWASSHRRPASGKQPPPRRIEQEATAAQHRARSHRRATSGKQPPPRRIGKGKEDSM